MSNIANLARTLISSSLTRNQLKVVRARLRRAQLTNVGVGTQGEYTINPSLDTATDARAMGGTVIVAALAEMA